MAAYDKLENESDDAYYAFRNFLAQGPSRQIARLLRDLGDDYGHSKIYRWKKIFRWAERASAYDKETLYDPMPVPVPAIMLNLKERVLSQAETDYNRLHDLWEQMLIESGGSLKPSELRALISARQQLDIFARKLAQLPSGYTAAKITDDSASGGPVVIEDHMRLTEDYSDEES